MCCEFEKIEIKANYEVLKNLSYDTNIPIISRMVLILDDKGLRYKAMDKNGNYINFKNYQEERNNEN